MKRSVLTLFVVLMTVSQSARADVLDELTRRVGPGTLLDSSVVLEVPWAGTVLRERSGEATGCYEKQSALNMDILLDSDPFGVLPTAWIEGHAVDPGLTPDVVSWALGRDLFECRTYAGRQVMLLQISGQLYGRVRALPAPVPSRCGGDDATVHVAIGEDTGVPASHARITYREGCDTSSGPPSGVINLRDIRINMLGGTAAPLSEPRIVELRMPGRYCGVLAPRIPQVLTGTVVLDVPPSPGAVFYYDIETVPDDIFRYGGPGVPEGTTEGVAFASVPEGFVGTLEVVVYSGPDEALRSSAATTVEILSSLDTDCPLSVLFERVRFDPIWEGCWACLFTVTPWRGPLVLNRQRVFGKTVRAVNGVVARNALGSVVSLSENPAGVPTSFIMQGGQVLHALPGIRLTALNVLGMAVGARVDPKGQLRSAILFDGQHIKDYGTLGGNASEALALSDAGWFVGWAEDAGGARRAFIARDRGLEPIPLPAHLESEATGIGGDRWVVGHLRTDKGRQGFLFDTETGAVHVAELPEAGSAIEFTQVDGWGRAVGAITTENQTVIPILFSAQEALVRLDQFLEYPEGFVPQAALGPTDDGSVFIAGQLDGAATWFRFSP